MKQLLWTVLFGMFAIGSLTISSGCSSSSSSSAKPGSSGPAIDSAQIGQACNGGTSPGDSVALKDSSCAAGVCLVEDIGGTLDDLQTYCSADCSNAQCPAGYVCQQTTLESSYDCFIDPSASGKDGG